MPRFAANLSMMFCEVPFLDRFAEAAAAGFKGVEYLFPYDFSTNDLISCLRDYSLQQVLFNMPAGDWQAGDRGLASIPGRELEFSANLDAMLSYANILGCQRVHMMAGIPPQDISYQQARDTYIRNLQLAARACRSDGITVLIEPINLRDMPGYFLHHQDQALELIEQAGEANIALQMDLYHCQITEGNLAKRIYENIEKIAHMQIAGVPERQEPDCGEVNYPYLFQLIDDLGYNGWVGCEYHPAVQTQAGLGWASAYGIG